MKLYYSAYVSVNNIGQKGFEELGVEIEERRKNTGKLLIETNEDDANWLAIKALVLKYSGKIFTLTSFTQKEVDSAAFLEFTANEKWKLDIPPSGGTQDPFGRIGGCSVCGVDVVQIAPIRIGKTVKWGRDSCFMITGLWDEVFVTPESWEEVFKPFAIDAWPVLEHPSGNPRKDVVQLKVPDLVELDLHETEPYIVCKECGKQRYDLHNIGFMPCPKTAPDTHIFKSSQWFGTGPTARRQLTITNELYQAIKVAKIKGPGFRPCGPQIPQWKQPMTAESLDD